MDLPLSGFPSDPLPRLLDEATIRHDSRDPYPRVPFSCPRSPGMRFACLTVRRPLPGVPLLALAVAGAAF
jgi:hypothetical protein